MRLLFIVNPSAGTGQKNIQDTILQWLESNPDHQSHLYQLQKETDCGQEIKQLIQQYQPERVVAAGGDGTIKLVAELIAGTSLPMAILPTGSANGMAAELNIPSDPLAALRLCVNGKLTTTDMIMVNNEWCIHLSDIGLNALLLQHFEAIPQRGMLGYARALFNMILRQNGPPRLTLHIQTDHKTFRRKAMMAIIANATKYGTGAIINPGGKINDGIFELVVIRKLPIGEIIKMLITRKPFNPWNIEIISCKQATLTCRKPSPFQVDGEYRGLQTRIQASIAPEIITLVLPDGPA